MRLALTCVFLFLFFFSHAQRTLQAYIDSAKANSPLIKDNLNQHRAGSLEIQRLKAQYLRSHVDGTGNLLFAPIVSTDNGTKFEFAPKDASSYYGYDLGVTNGGQYQGLVAITKPLFNDARYKAFAEQVEVGREINLNNIRLAEHDIEKLVTDEYVLCLLDMKQIAYANEILRILFEQRDIVQRLAKNAIAKQSDYILLNTEYVNNEGQLALNEANYRRDLFDLKILAGVRDTSVFTLDTLALNINYSSLLNTSPYLDKYRLDSLNLLSSQKVFETKYKPQINLFANGGLNAVDPATLYRRFGVSAGVSVAWNLFDGRQKEINRQRTNILLQSVGAYKENFLVQNELRKSKFLSELASYKQRAALLQQQLNGYNQVIYSYRKELLSGEQSVINLITVIKSMAAVQRDLSLLQTNQYLLINAYNYWNW